MGSSMTKLYAADQTSFDFNTVDLADEVDPDELLVEMPAIVKNIHVVGLSKTKDEVVTNQLSKLFDAKTFSSLMSEALLGKLKLERLGIFANIEVLVDVSKDGQDCFDVHYIVKEKRQVTASIGTNIGANEGGMSMKADINNIRGIGEALKGSLNFGTHVSSGYELSYVKPFVSDSDKKFSVHVNKSMTDFTQSQYKENSKGIGFGFQLPSPIGVHNLDFNFTWRDNVIYPTAPFDVRKNAGHTLKSSIKHILTSDGRDDWILPSKGHLFKHVVEYSGIGGNINALKSDVQFQFNKELVSNIVLAGCLQAGIAQPLTNESLLINDRVFLGGPISVRGFATNGIGKHSGTASLGGEGYWASGLHIYTPLPFRPGQGGFGELFRLHLFANAGNITNINDLNVIDFLRNPRYSYGAGVMLMLGGVARLELNYCIPRNAQPGDIINSGLQLGVGLNFL